jgi:hypothetical protein
MRHLLGREMSVWRKVWRLNAAGLKVVNYECSALDFTINMRLVWMGESWRFDCWGYFSDPEVSLANQIQSAWNETYGANIYQQQDIERAKQDVETLIDRLNAMSSFL